MKLGRPYILFILTCLWLLFSPIHYNLLWGKDFVLVIDACHGGHDPGAIGKISKEKNINLNVALKLGNLIKKNCKDTKVIYTREKDVFVPLAQRSEIANNAKADLFISIHTNALKNNKTTQGASTWTLGLAKSEANLDVAKRENAVILYENDYQTRYAGFNPNSAESYIIFEFMQDKYMEQSVHLASLVQKEFGKTGKRVDRGVHQAGFLVLKASAMPSILIELGFISTPAEERFLNTEAGASSMAKSIYNAFLRYKHEYALRHSDFVETQSSHTEVPKAEAIPEPTGGEIVFKVQILTSKTVLNTNDKRLKGVKNVDYYYEKGLYKYTTGASTDYNQALRTKRSLTEKFKDAFVIAFKGNQKMDITQAINEFKSKKE